MTIGEAWDVLGADARLEILKIMTSVFRELDGPGVILRLSRMGWSGMDIREQSAVVELAQRFHPLFSRMGEQLRQVQR